MAKQKSGTPATTALDRAGISYQLHPYDHADDEVHFGEEAAAKLGVDPAVIFKTLVVDTGSGLAVGVVPVAGQLDLKAMAGALSVKKVAMADPAAATRSSGYVLGGISPIGQRTALPTIVDSSAAGLASVMVSAGRRGLQVRLAPADLVSVTGARYADIGR